METNYQAFQCPNFGPAQVERIQFGRISTGYGYNGNFLSRASGIDYAPPTWAPAPSSKPLARRFRDVAQLTQTIMFADSAGVFCTDWTCAPCEVREKLAAGTAEQRLPDSSLPPLRRSQCGVRRWHVETRGGAMAGSFVWRCRQDGKDPPGICRRSAAGCSQQDEFYDCSKSAETFQKSPRVATRGLCVIHQSKLCFEEFMKRIVLLLLLGAGCGGAAPRLTHVPTGWSSMTRDEAANRGKTSRRRRLPSIPATGRATLVPASYCPVCKAWQPSPSIELRQRNPKAALCPKDTP